MNSIRLEWKQERGGLFVWLFFMVLIMGLMMAMFPVMANQGMEDILTTKLDAMPPEMLEAFSLTNGASLLQATGFFAYIFQYLFLATCIFATMKGAQALIKEETNGTIEYLYAQPISRKAIVTSKYIANLVLLMIFWIVLYGAALLFIYLFKEDGADFVEIIKDITLMFGAESLVLLFFYSIGFLFSTFIASSRSTSGVALLLVFSTYMIGLVSKMVEDYEFLRVLSPIEYAHPAALLEEGVSWEYMVICIVGSLLALGLSYLIYGRKDLRIQV